jgi:AhpD family alkylhydroperoxidase
MESARAISEGLRGPSRDLRNAIPDAYAGFVELSTKAMADGALDRRTKELIALAIAISKQCDGCIVAHARGALSAGATEAEVADAIAVTFVMNGGPATVYGPRALAAYKEVAAEKAARAAGRAAADAGGTPPTS